MYVLFDSRPVNKLINKDKKSEKQTFFILLTGTIIIHPFTEILVLND